MAITAVRPARHELAQSVLDLTEALWADARVEPGYRQAMRSALVPAQDLTTLKRVAFGSPPLIALPGLSCEAAGGNRLQADPVSAAWGLLYYAAHLLDAVEDGQVEIGAGLPSPGSTINVAIGLMTSAALALSALEDSGTSPEVVQDIRSRFHGIVLTMCGGQHADLTRSEPSLDECWQAAQAKSGAFFDLACWAGARLASRDSSQPDPFGLFGQNLGTVIQIRDDLSGLSPVAGEISDLASGGSWTLPVAYTMSVVPEGERDQLRHLLQAARSDATALVEARRRIIESGAVLYLTVEVERRRRQAEAALMAASQPSKARGELLALLREVCTLRNA
ncbi:MAG: polyprenyl synthetase family protein [Anaerolineales bacterium]|nr:polyprenyl synthetase family protein [Anaerolineales bacterium]